MTDDGRTLEHGHPISSSSSQVMVYIYNVGLLSLILHAKFQNHSPSGSGEEDF